MSEQKDDIKIDLESIMNSMEEGSPIEEPIETPIEEPIIEPTIEPIEKPTEEIIEDPIVESIIEEGNPPEPVVESTPNEGMLTAYYEQMQEFGGLNVPEEFEFDGTEEAFQEAIKLNKQSVETDAVQSFFERLPEDYQNALQYVVNGGSSLEDYMGAATKNINYEEADLSTNTQQEQVLREYYKSTTKFDDKKIERFIGRLKEDDVLEEEALDALEYMKDFTRQRQADLLDSQRLKQEAQETKFKQARDSYMEAVDNAAYIKGQRKKKVKAFGVNVVTKDGMEDTARNLAIRSIYSNPQHQAQLDDLLLEYDSKKGFDFSRIKASAKKDTVSSFQKKLEQRISVQSNRGKTLDPKTSQVNWGEILKQYD